MPRGYAEIVITINPIGMEKAEVIGIEDDPDSEMMGVEMYQQLAVASHRRRKEAKDILCSHWDKGGVSGYMQKGVTSEKAFFFRRFFRCLQPAHIKA